MPPRASKRLAKGRGEAEDSAPLPTAPTAPPPLVRKQKKAVNQPKAVDRLSFLSSELLAVILHQLSPATAPDLLSLFHFATVSKHLAVHVKTHLYRSLSINTRTDAHAVHRTLHGNDLSRCVKSIEADVGKMAKTSSQWLGWFLFHSMHSLSGIIASCRTLLTLTLFLPSEASAWTQSLCNSLVDLKLLHTLTKDMEIAPHAAGGATTGAGRHEGMDVGWKQKRSVAMWSVSQFLKPLATLKSLHTLRLCGISSDSSTAPPLPHHNLRLIEVVLIEVNITNSDLLHLLGSAQTLKKLTIWRSSLLSKKGLTHVLKRCPNLVELRVGGSWFGAKDEEDANFPIDLSIAFLPHLRLLHVSGSLVSPAILLNSLTNLNHLLVVSCPSFAPPAIHAALAKMRSDPSPIVKLTLPEMGWRNGGVAPGQEPWNESWRFSVRVTAEAKGVTLDDGSRDGEVDTESGSE